MIEVLRLGHRIPRDSRITTHVALTARSFGASRMYYSGQHDKEMVKSVLEVVKRFGGDFSAEYVKEPLRLVLEKKNEGFKIVHLTMYGVSFKEKLKDIKKINKVLYVIGGAKVEPEYYQISDFNISVSSQPISEVSALGIMLYELYGFKNKFEGAKVKIIPSEKGKVLKEE